MIFVGGLERCPPGGLSAWRRVRLEACPPGGVSAWRRVRLEACPPGGLSAGEMTANLPSWIFQSIVNNLRVQNEVHIIFIFHFWCWFVLVLSFNQFRESCLWACHLLSSYLVHWKLKNISQHTEMNILVSWVKIGVWSDTFTYKAQAMCTTRFGSQGLILDDFFLNKRKSKKKKR